MRRRLLFANEEVIPNYEIIDYDPENWLEDKDHELVIHRTSPDTLNTPVNISINIIEDSTVISSINVDDNGNENFSHSFIVHPTKDSLNIIATANDNPVSEEYTFRINKKKNNVYISFNNTGIASVFVSGSSAIGSTWIYYSSNIAAYDGDNITWTAYSQDSHCWYGNNNTTSISGNFVAANQTVYIPDPYWKIFDIYVNIPVGIDYVYITGSNVSAYRGGFYVYWSGWTTGCVEHTDQITWTAYPSNGYRTVNGSGTERVYGDVYIYPTAEVTDGNLGSSSSALPWGNVYIYSRVGSQYLFYPHNIGTVPGTPVGICVKDYSASFMFSIEDLGPYMIIDEYNYRDTRFTNISGTNAASCRQDYSSGYSNTLALVNSGASPAASVAYNYIFSNGYRGRLPTGGEYHTFGMNISQILTALNSCGSSIANDINNGTSYWSCTMPNRIYQTGIDGTNTSFEGIIFGSRFCLNGSYDTWLLVAYWECHVIPFTDLP